MVNGVEQQHQFGMNLLFLCVKIFPLQVELGKMLLKYQIQYDTIKTL